jgi:hypothetical protein
MTKTQITTNILFVLYALWEILVQIWELRSENSGPIIRVDLLIIYPVLLILIIISTIQFIKKRNRKNIKQKIKEDTSVELQI